MEEKVINVIVPLSDGTYKVTAVYHVYRLADDKTFNTIEDAVAEICMRKMGV